MIKLLSAQPLHDHCVRLRFSDGSHGVHDFSALLAAETEMMRPLRDPSFFRRCFIEAGALAWPHGLDFSAKSLQLRLVEAGRLERDSKAT